MDERTFVDNVRVVVIWPALAAIVVGLALVVVVFVFLARRS